MTTIMNDIGRRIFDREENCEREISIEVYEGGYRLNDDATIIYDVAELALSIFESMDSNSTYRPILNKSNTGRMGRTGTSLIEKIIKQHNDLVNKERSQGAGEFT